MSTVLVEDADGVRTLTLNRPERLNAFDQATRELLNEELRRADADAAVRCIVITGAGRAFSAGADLKEEGPVPHGEGALAWHRFLESTNQGDAPIDTRSLTKPVVAAVNGLCYGIGMLAAVECDLLVAAASARFGMLEARMGSGGSTVLPFLIGPQWTRFLMYSGETIDAETAKRIGLVIEVIPDGDLAARVHDLAARIAAMPPLQVFLSKRQTEGTLAMMGKLANEVFSLPNQAILNSLAGEATAPDGRKLLDVLEEEGVAGLIEARDGKHEEPWLR